MIIAEILLELKLKGSISLNRYDGHNFFRFLTEHPIESKIDKVLIELDLNTGNMIFKTCT